MKFHLQAPPPNVVTGSGPGWVRVGQTEYRGNIVLLPDAVVEGWAPSGFAALTEADFAALLAHRPETVLLGTGAQPAVPASAPAAGVVRRARRRRGDGHARRVPHVQHPRRRGPARGGGSHHRLSKTGSRSSVSTLAPRSRGTRVSLAHLHE